ncbi:sulfotransferase [Sphingomonas sp. LY160]|uniref:sulfotransferase family protein n=1 Tax=Sphingomonas sp. LY160 TaxID=3095342 RepID=UPI002ADEE8AF|nr:sulfotransferase [Sphingomonas sp. LY160]MEA1071713.1 sulfotransferase [Sphingomonas sp. LY160]
MRDRPQPASAWPRFASRGLERMWGIGLSSRPEIDPDAIVAAAVRREGREPTDGCWRDRLSILCRSINEEAALNSLGRTIAYAQLVKLVAARIRAARWFAGNPEILDRPLAPPVIIVGQMRSGTTRIHRLLACDPHFATNRLFEQLDPVPYPQKVLGVDRRRPAAAAVSLAFRLFEPGLSAIHPSSADAVEEEFGLHAYSFWGPMFEGQWRVPSFVDHVEQADPAPIYREFADLLRLTGWARGDDPTRPWLLKAPQFSQELGALIAAFPDARIVNLCRPAADVVASGASLIWHHARVQSDAVTRHDIGNEVLRKTRLREDRLSAALRTCDVAKRVDLHFDDVSRDWRQAIRSIYRTFDRSLSADVERRMEAFVARSTDHLGHRYSLEDFGLDRASITSAFTPRQVSPELT